MTAITNSEKKPKEKKAKMYTFVDPEMKKRIEALAEKSDRSPSAMIRVLIIKGIEQYDDNER